MNLLFYFSLFLNLFCPAYFSGTKDIAYYNWDYSLTDEQNKELILSTKYDIFYDSKIYSVLPTEVNIAKSDTFNIFCLTYVGNRLVSFKLDPIYTKAYIIKDKIRLRAGIRFNLSLLKDSIISDYNYKLTVFSDVNNYFINYDVAGDYNILLEYSDQFYTFRHNLLVQNLPKFYDVIFINERLTTNILNKLTEGDLINFVLNNTDLASNLDFSFNTNYFNNATYSDQYEVTCFVNTNDTILTYKFVINNETSYKKIDTINFSPALEAWAIVKLLLIFLTLTILFKALVLGFSHEMFI